MMFDSLHRSLTAVGRAGTGIKDWWIIGSAAAVLSGVEDVEPNDVDIFGPEGSMLEFLASWKTPAGPRRPDRHFRSYPYARVQRPGQLDIEVMGGLEVRTEGFWQPVQLQTRQAVTVAGVTLFVPDIPEQIELLKLFGRPKDMEKAEKLVSVACLKDG